MAGIKSDAVRARLLGLSDAEASLDKCITLASAVELSADVSRSFTPYRETTTDCPSGSVAAVDGHPKKPVNETTKRCSYCGLAEHKRQRCPTKNSNRLKCGKTGHWPRV